MLDSTWAYDYPAALRVGRAIEELGFYWYEDPLADEDLYNYVKLKQKLDIPILATEYPGGLHRLRALDHAAGHRLPARRRRGEGRHHDAGEDRASGRGFHMNFEIHHGGNSLNNVANLHVIMAIRNCEYFEVLLPDGAQKYGLVQDIEVGRDGLVHAPTGPGLGAAIDFELIERKKMAVLA